MAKKKAAVPHISTVGFASANREREQHYRELREAISAASRLINDIEGTTKSPNVFKVAMTGTLRRLERIIDPDEIEFIAIPRPSPTSAPEPQFDNTPNIPLEKNKLITELYRLKSKRGGHWIKVDSLTFEQNPSKAIIGFSKKFGGAIGTLTIYMVPGKKHWGINRIATSGDTEFNEWATTPKEIGGMLPAGTEYANQMLIDATKRKPKELNLRTEQAVFNHCKINYIPLILRTDKLWLTYIETGQNMRRETEPLELHKNLEEIEDNMR